jgi:thioester reductase-like protein
MRVFVTGATGYIGPVLEHVLEEDFWPAPLSSSP